MSYIAITTTSTTRSIPVFQKTVGLLPSFSNEIWNGYVSPSGGYVNYACYIVSGLDEKTGRKRKKRIKAQNERVAAQYALSEGLCAPLSIELIPNDPPTEAQLAYARDLLAVLPENACFHDVSAIITRIYENDEAPVEDSLAECALKHGLFLSKYSGKRIIMELIDQLTPQEQKKFRADLRAIRKIRREQGGAHVGKDSCQTSSETKAR